MKTIVYHNVHDKSEWGPGPWVDEPDKMQWEHANGYPCLVVRNRFGSLCGYVGVPATHPLHGKHYDDPKDINVHGGLTFAGGCMEDAPEDKGICHKVEYPTEEGVWWFGFDTGHAFDLSPGLNATVLACPGDHEGYKKHVIAQQEYRDLAYVRHHVNKLARQLKKLEAA